MCARDQERTGVGGPAVEKPGGSTGPRLIAKQTSSDPGHPACMCGDPVGSPHGYMNLLGTHSEARSPIPSHLCTLYEMSDRDHEKADPKVHTTHEKPVSIWRDMVINRRSYWMAASACWGGMLFGWDTGLIGGIVSTEWYIHLEPYSSTLAAPPNLVHALVRPRQEPRGLCGSDRVDRHRAASG